jgi:Mg2+ and Co2+ transporter CorA
MNSNSKALQRPINNVEVGVYECEIHLKFRLVEEKSLFSDRDQLLQVLLEALVDSSDDFIQTLQASVKAQETSELKASPQMRRQLMRLRNSTETNQP